MLDKTLCCLFLLYFIVTAKSHDCGDNENKDDSSRGHEGQSDEGNRVENPRSITPSGAIKGSFMDTRKGRRFEAYRGIRYAEPPVGDLRFQLPQPILTYNEEVDASEEGPACPTLAEESYYPNFSEDCLRLNVYTPRNSVRNTSLPVMVYIHAGGFYGFSGRSDLAGPQYLLDRDIVLVTINYRLGSLGFLSTGDELAPGNNGLKDQVVALRWIQKNIASFGGDPNLVTITGCSAGALSVMLHMISPMSKGLFHRGISMSGSPTLQVMFPSDLKRLAVRQAKLVNCPTNSSRVIIDCLKTKPWREIGDSLDGFLEFGYNPIWIFLPVIEKDFGQPRFLTIQPDDAIREGKMHTVPYIVSQTELEFYWKVFAILENSTLLNEMNANWTSIAPISFILPRDQSSVAAAQRLRHDYLHDRPLANDSDTEHGLATLYGDSIIGFSVHRLANLMARHSSEKVFYYELTYVGNHSHYEDPVTNKPIGAVHHDDLIYLFGLTYRFPLISADSPDGPFVDKMTAIWYNFAKYGDPNPRDESSELSSLSWPPITPTAHKYLRLDRTFEVKENLKEDRFKIWEELYPIQY